MEQKEILVVEDDADIRENIAEFLESEGFSVRKATDGLQALEILRSHSYHPNAILLDLMMPRMDGFKFREAQKNDQSLADIPVILMTADSNIESNHQKIGAVASIRKPIDIDQLSTLLKDI